MAERRKRERRDWKSKPAYPFFDSDGNWVTSDRRRVVERRVSGFVEKPPSSGQAQRLRLFFNDRAKELPPDAAAPLLLGRAASCDIEVPAPQVSRQHARIEPADAGFALIDQSTNGTYVRFDSGGQTHVLKGRIAINGSGIISLGKPIQEREPHLIYFWCHPIESTG